ncbi:MAG: phosphatase PAP2 family protein [Proteobacteria bacterium]|uniref:phosphatase PAP2 family protein n=1 Tax=Aquabacterium sp. TaxID=1872578 RepID=UPI0035C67FDD|nr:phosphatase PAP2 family protein [Pseudomonadota bacterium]
MTPSHDAAEEDDGMATRLLWASLFFALAVYAKFPGLDLLVSANYFDPARGFFRAQDPLVRALYDWTPTLGRILFVVMLAHALLASWLGRGLEALGRTGQASRCRGPWRHLSVVFVCAALLGPGLLIEGVLKNTVGRPRPVQTDIFGGSEPFHGPFTPGDNPERHRSFVSSHAATGFALMALGLTGGAATRRRWLLVGLIAGSAVGTGRIMQGGHYLSDIVFAFYAVWLSCELVRWLDARRLRKAQPPPSRPHRPAQLHPPQPPAGH